MKSFYTNIKSTIDSVYSTHTQTYKINLVCNAYWAQYKMDNGSWEYYNIEGKELTLTSGNHIFVFRGSAGWAPPVDFTYNVQADKKLFIVYKKTYNILIDHLENHQFGEIFYATKV